MDNGETPDDAVSVRPMSIVQETTARSRELGSDLRRIRERAGYSGVQMAERLCWSTTKVSRLETGRRGTTRTDVAAYVASCGVLGPELERLVALAEPLEDGYWVQANEPIPDELRTLVYLEKTTNSISSYQPLVVPGLVQTEQYIRALFQGVGVIPKSGIEPCVHARMTRQELLRSDDCPQLQFFIHENALLTPVGGSQVMHEQMLHLLFLSDESPCRIRVVPREAGARAASLTGPFVFFRFRGHRPTVYLEHHTASVFLDQNRDVGIYRSLLSSLAACALTEEESRSLLANLASSYDS